MKVVIRKLRKYYGERKIIDIEKLILESGMIYGIIGCNGSGKTTLLRIISGLDMEFEGSICYESQDGQMVGLEKIRDEVVMHPQKPYIFNMSVRNNVEIGVRARKNGNYKKVEAVIDCLGLKTLEKRNALRISGGEAQRTALARVLSLEPGLLILDEPTANIDVENTNIIEKAILNMKKDNNKTILMVTHNVFQAIRLCDYLICLEGGKIIEMKAKKNIRESKIVKELFEYNSTTI